MSTANNQKFHKNAQSLFCKRKSIFLPFKISFYTKFHIRFFFPQDTISQNLILYTGIFLLLLIFGVSVIVTNIEFYIHTKRSFLHEKKQKKEKKHLDWLGFIQKQYVLVLFVALARYLLCYCAVYCHLLEATVCIIKVSALPMQFQSFRPVKYAFESPVAKMFRSANSQVVACCY